MRKFIILDPSLKSPGGHHFDLARLIGQAAADSGYHIILACHRRIRLRASFPGAWTIEPLFSYMTYDSDSVLWGRVKEPVDPFAPGADRADSAADVPRWHSRLCAAWRRWRRKRMSESFITACRRLVAKYPLGPQDQVFLPTATEFDVVGLAKFLGDVPAALRAHWHVYFHNPFLSGISVATVEDHQRLAAMKRHFSRWLLPLANSGRVHFYATTTALTAQYNRAAGGCFEHLPWCANPVYQALGETGGRGSSRDHCGPLRIICAGRARKDKGQDRLQALLESLSEEFLDCGKIQLHIQSQKALHGLSKDIAQRKSPKRVSAVIRLPHPLSDRDYMELIRTADAGLFLYDAQQYVTRCSGVMTEMLCAGIPVIVPAGTWMASEIARPISEHRRRLSKQLPCLVQLRGAADKHHAERRHAIGGSTFAIQRQVDSWIAEFDLPAGAGLVEVSVAPQRCELHQEFRAELAVVDAESTSPTMDTVLVDGDRQSSLLWLPVSGGLRAKLTLSVMQGELPAHSSQMQIRILGLPGDRRGPTGGAGLVWSDMSQLPRLFDELVTHYAHYRNSARQFSKHFAPPHHPQCLVQRLEGQSLPRNSVAI